jgi:succinylglutamate desuccinylase
MTESQYISAHPEIAGVHCITATPVAADPQAWPRPFVGIVASMHGNEACGLEAMHRLEERASREEFSIEDGTLFLIHGNLDASEQGRRHTEGGTDLNRLFNFGFVDDLPEHRWSSEHHRALALRPLLESLDVALDLHSTSAPTPPFGIVSHIKSSRPLARKLGLPYLTHGWEGPGLLGDLVMMQMLSCRDKPSIAVECGQHDDPRSIERARETIERFLVACAMLLSEAASTPREPALELVIVDAIKKPSPGFGFAGRLIGLQQVAAGALVGCDENLEIRSTRNCFVIMPNASVEVGSDMLYLAHQIDPTRDFDAGQGLVPTP